MKFSQELPLKYIILVIKLNIIIIKNKLFNNNNLQFIIKIYF